MDRGGLGGIGDEQRRDARQVLVHSLDAVSFLTAEPFKANRQVSDPVVDQLRAPMLIMICNRVPNEQWQILAKSRNPPSGFFHSKSLRLGQPSGRGPNVCAISRRLRNKSGVK